jgi:hypothetical protein
MKWATMPEATVHKDRQLQQSKREVRLAGEVLMAAPTCNCIPSQDRGETHLGVAVAARPDCGHDL